MNEAPSFTPSFTPGVKRKREIFITGNVTDQMINVAIMVDQILNDVERHAGTRLNIEQELTIRRRLASLVESSRAEITAIRGIVSKAAGRSDRRPRPGRPAQGNGKGGNGASAPGQQKAAPTKKASKKAAPKKASPKPAAEKSVVEAPTEKAAVAATAHAAE